jgi:hypothetical protein
MKKEALETAQQKMRDAWFISTMRADKEALVSVTIEERDCINAALSIAIGICELDLGRMKLMLESAHEIVESDPMFRIPRA